MDSLYEAVQSSSDGPPPPPIPSRSSSRSCSPAVLLDDKWRGSGRSISMVRAANRLKVTSCRRERRSRVSNRGQIIWGGGHNPSPTLQL